MRVGSVVVDCNDFAAMLAFWRAALRYEPREPPEDGWVVLQDPAGADVNVSLQQVPEPRAGKNRLHLDLYSDDQAGEVERLLGLGARRVDIGQGEVPWAVLADPEGNEFCVLASLATLDQNGSP